MVLSLEYLQLFKALGIDLKSPVNQLVVGSIPTVGANINPLSQWLRGFLVLKAV